VRGIGGAIIKSWHNQHQRRRHISGGDIDYVGMVFALLAASVSAPWRKWRGGDIASCQARASRRVAARAAWRRVAKRRRRRHSSRRGAHRGINAWRKKKNSAADR